MQQRNVTSLKYTVGLWLRNDLANGLSHDIPPSRTQDFGNPPVRGGMSVQTNMYLSQPGTFLTSENVLYDSEINRTFAVIARKRILH